MRCFMKYAKRIIALLLVALPILAMAQMANSTKIVGEVPFSFMVGGRHIPAGQCVVERAGESPRVLVIRNVAAKVGLFIPATPNLSKKASESYALVFHKYGDRAFLTGIKL